MSTSSYVGSLYEGRGESSGDEGTEPRLHNELCKTMSRSQLEQEGADAEAVCRLLESLREGGVNARDQDGQTPLHFAVRNCSAAVDLLVRLGADVNARDERGRTPIFECARVNDAAMLRRLLAHGASPDVVSDDGYTPLLLHACMNCMNASHQVGEAGETALALTRGASRETRRAVVAHRGLWDNGFSAVDFIRTQRRLFPELWQVEVMAELLVSGASVLPQHAADVLPVVMSHVLPLAAQKEAAGRSAQLCSSWRAHEAFVGLVLDVQELEAAEKDVEGKRQRVLELKMELLALGAGTESSSGSDEEDCDDDESQSANDESDGEDESDGGVDKSESASQSENESKSESESVSERKSASESKSASDSESESRGDGDTD